MPNSFVEKWAHDGHYQDDDVEDDDGGGNDDV